MVKIKHFSPAILIPVLIFFVVSGCKEKLQDGGLRIGWAMEDITPEDPVPLIGQYYERISKYVETPLKVTALAIESPVENGQNEQAICISMDLVATNESLQNALREKIKEQIPDSILIN